MAHVESSAKEAGTPTSKSPVDTSDPQSHQHESDSHQQLPKPLVTSQPDSGGTTPDHSTSVSPTLVRRSTTTPLLSSSTSATSTNSSPKPSREGSPIRHHVKPALPPAGRRSATRSRKNSHELSPARGPSGASSIPTVPSAAAIQRALSAAGGAALLPPAAQTDGTSEPSKSRIQAPRNSRLTSPAPSGGPTRKPDAAPAPTPTKRQNRTSSDTDEDQPRSGGRTPLRQATTNVPKPLETVQETSVAASPEHSSRDDTQSDDRHSGNESSSGRSTSQNMTDSNSSLKPPQPAPPAPLQSKKSFTQLTKTATKPSEGSVKNMTVETETVSSVPQVALATGKDAGGSVRLKPSIETIRPKKEKKRVARKVQSLNAAGPSSKADIFEAKVASAVDEADSSDSEETFVYESNPPEPLSVRPHRYHSRTPSTASTFSQKDPGKKLDAPKVVGKKSMKFATNYNALHPDEHDGTVRGPSTRGGTAHHHHIGRYGRSHPSIVDDSPFPGTRTPRSATSQLQQLSPQVSRHTRGAISPRKVEESLDYSLDEDGADDEETPLVRSTNRRRRPLPGSVRQGFTSTTQRRRGSCGRIVVFASLGGFLAILIAAVILILVLCSKPLENVHIRSIKHVLASESEMMLDLHVSAVNPNLVGVQVGELDVNIFAKSRHVGTSSNWRQHQDQHRHQHNGSHSGIIPPYKPSTIPPSSSDVTVLDGVDHGTDPIDDPQDPSPPNDEAQTMLLGQILHFDSPLTFTPSPLRHRASHSVGELRLSHPGNKTEEGGSKRWEHVLQHDFELIVRGVVKYSIPLGGGSGRSASVLGRVTVRKSDDEGDDDDEGDGDDDKGNSTLIA